MYFFLSAQFTTICISVMTELSFLVCCLSPLHPIVEAFFSFYMMHSRKVGKKVSFFYLNTSTPPYILKIFFFGKQVSLLNQEVIIEKIQSVIELRLRNSNESKTFQEQVLLEMLQILITGFDL